MALKNRLAKFLLITVMGLTLLVIVWLSIGGIVAGNLEGESADLWTQRGWTEETSLELYPIREANASARQLVDLGAALGVKISPNSWVDPVPVDPAAETAFKGIKDDLSKYLDRTLGRADETVEPPPEGVSAYLNTWRQQISAVAEQLNEVEAPTWDSDITLMWEAPIPNLLGHLGIQRILVASALEEQLGGRPEAAERLLEAAWNLAQSLHQRPTLISQMIRIASLRYVVGVVRKVDVDPRAWQERLAEVDAPQLLSSALLMEAWMTGNSIRSASGLTEIFNVQDGGIATGLLFALPSFMVRPFVRSCAASNDLVMLEAIAGMEALDPCAEQAESFMESVEATIPSWNLVSQIAIPNLTGVWDRGQCLAFDLEMSALVLEGKALAAENGIWPEELPRASSSRCAGESWTYELGPDGSVAIGYSRELEWPNQRGLILPMQFIQGAVE